MKKFIFIFLISCLFFMSACSVKSSDTKVSNKEYIEEKLNLKNNTDTEWSYDSETNSWTLSPVVSVANPVIAEKEGISVNIPGEYVEGIDTNTDEKVDITSENYSQTVKGHLIINSNAKITSPNGQTYSATTAPIIYNTGAAGYGSQETQNAPGTYARDGYINVTTGNRGKNDEADGSFTGDAPSALVDQKASARFLRYNILLGNLPGNPNYLVSTGGSGGGAHAVMLAATSNDPTYYPYEIEVGAVGVYENEDGTFTTEMTIDGNKQNISDGAWGTIAYSPITSLKNADAALAFEYNLNKDFQYNSEFQSELASLLSESYMQEINAKDLKVDEGKIQIDLNNDGDLEDTIDLKIEYDPEKYASTNGYGGTYIDLYKKKFEKNLSEYVNNLSKATDWTWFDENGTKLTDEQVTNMSTEDRINAFLEGRYTASNQKSGQMPKMSPGDSFDNSNGLPNLDKAPDNEPPDLNSQNKPPELENKEEVGTPDDGTTQSANSTKDSQNYETFEAMLEAYQNDIDEINQGDKYGNNIVDLYDPIQFLKSEQTEKPAWAKIIMGAQEGDISMFSSLELELALIDAGVNTTVEWQWNSGHVPSEIFGDSFTRTVDQMYGEYVEGAQKIGNSDDQEVKTNGNATQASGENISSWATYKNGNVELSTEDLLKYRTSKANKAVPGFDVIDYGQEDYVFGSSTQDARHWNETLLKIFNDNTQKLQELFNKEN